MLQAKISAGKYEAVIAALGNDEVIGLFGPTAMFCLGEAYRLRNANGDRDKAMTCYEAARKEVVGFAPLFRSMGILYFKKGAYTAAVASFQRYLQLNPDGSDSDFMRQYIQAAQRREEKQ